MKQKETKVNKIMIYTDLTSHDVLLSYPKKVRKHTVLEVKTDGTTQINQINKKENENKARMYVWSEQKLKMIWELRKKNQKSKMSNGWTWHL